MAPAMMYYVVRQQVIQAVGVVRIQKRMEPTRQNVVVPIHIRIIQRVSGLVVVRHWLRQRKGIQLGRQDVVVFQITV